MSDDHPQIRSEDSPLLWFAMLVGPLAWSAHLLLAYALVPTVCDTGWTVLFVIVTIGTALISLSGAVVSRRLTTGDRSDTATGDVRRTNAIDRMRFISAAGFASGLFFTAVIIAEGLPILFLDPCTWG